MTNLQTSMKRRLVAVIAMMAAMIALTGSPAHAAWACNSGYICIYETEFGNGQSYYWGPNYPAGCYNIGGVWNDRARSAYNRMTASQGNPVTFYDGAGCPTTPQPHPAINVYRGLTKSFIPAQTYGPHYSSFRIFA